MERWRERFTAVWLTGDRSRSARLDVVRLDERAGRASCSKKGATFGGVGQPSGRPRPRIFSRIPGVGWSSFGLGMYLPLPDGASSAPNRDLALRPSEGSCQGPPLGAASPPRALIFRDREERRDECRVGTSSQRLLTTVEFVGYVHFRHLALW